MFPELAQSNRLVFRSIQRGGVPFLTSNMGILLDLALLARATRLNAAKL